MSREGYKEVFSLASDIRKQFIESGTVAREKFYQLYDLCDKHEIEVYFDEDDIPEQVEDERL